MSLKSLQILNDHEYFTEITQKIAATNAGDRVALMSMAFAPDELLTEPLMRELTAAAKRGVHVQLNIDAMAFMTDDAHNLPTGPLLWHGDVARSKRADFRAKFELLEQLRNNGGSYHVTNLPKHRITNPFAGRSHIKFTLINDIVYVGGCNLGASWQLDMMVRVEGPGTADWVYDFIRNATDSDSVAAMLMGKDAVYSIDTVTQLFVDAGIKRQSLIYEQALQFIDEAKDWIVITCQYFPGSRTAKHLAAALRRGVDVQVYFGDPSKQGAFSLPHRIVEFGERIKYPKRLFEHRVSKTLPGLHAKLLATEQGAMIGGHNYVTQGVNFGTAEATLLRLDPEFAHQAVAVFKARIAEAENASASIIS